MRRRYSFALVGKNSFRREGIARILRSANIRTLASVTHVLLVCREVRSCQLLFLIVHTGDDFDASVE
jgi:two-component system nitrate/nitrite response regulator NarL